MIIVCQSLGSRPVLVLELFTLVPRLFGTTCRCLSVQPVQLLPSRNIWRHISLLWPFPHRYRHSPWPVDVTELFPRLCCWILIWLLRHWDWLHWGYWRYRRLIYWLIEVEPSRLTFQMGLYRYFATWHFELLLPLQFVKRPGPLTAFLGFPHGIRMLHESRHVACCMLRFIFLQRVPHAASDQKACIRNHAHSIILFASYRIPRALRV